MSAPGKRRVARAAGATIAPTTAASRRFAAVNMAPLRTEHERAPLAPPQARADPLLLRLRRP
jgi:hypothetical protein